MSEQWPQSFYFVDDESDVITFRAPDTVEVCKSGCRWSWSWVIQSRRWIPCERLQEAKELTALRRFHATVLQATQDTSNSKLPHAIFQADDALAKIVPRTKAET
jgi:hypothetical protein